MVVAPLAGCGSPGGRQASAAPSTDPDGDRTLAGAELAASQVEGAKVRAACEGSNYASPPSADLTSVDIEVRVQLPHFAQPIQLCVLLDDARLLTDADAIDGARRLGVGENITIHAGATTGTRHRVVIRASFNGLSPWGGYHFVVTSHRSFELSGAETRPVVGMLLFERPHPRLEQRPTVDWFGAGPIILHRDQ